MKYEIILVQQYELEGNQYLYPPDIMIADRYEKINDVVNFIRGSSKVATYPWSLIRSIKLVAEDMENAE